MKSFNKQNIISLVFFLTVSWTSIAHADSLRCEADRFFGRFQAGGRRYLRWRLLMSDVTGRKTIKVYRSKPEARNRIRKSPAPRP
jgi:hypothetical protein